MDAYEYPDVLYCDRCKKDVDVKIEERTESGRGKDRAWSIKYIVAVCPECGNTLCARDRDFAMAGYDFGNNEEGEKADDRYD